jgi:hypothetical protein
VGQQPSVLQLSIELTRSAGTQPPVCDENRGSHNPTGKGHRCFSRGSAQ